MDKITVTFDIAQPPDRVFAFLTDFGKLTTWRNLDELRLEPAGAAQIGTRLFSRVTAMGRHMEFVNEITALDAVGRYYNDRFLSGTFPIQSSWRVEERGGNSRIVWETEFQPTGVMRLLPFLLKRGIRSGQINDLAKIKEILEK